MRVVQFVTINVQNIRKLFSTFGPGLTLRQNKHVFMASRGKGAPQKLQGNLFYQPYIRLKNTPKYK
jgi:hypothetical protein